MTPTQEKQLKRGVNFKLCILDHNMDSVPTQLFIDGAFVDAQDGSTFEVISPATGKKLKDVAAAGAADVDKAVQAAKACLYSDSWGFKSTGAQRATVLRKFGTILASSTAKLVEIECLDNGKARREAEADFGDPFGRGS